MRSRLFILLVALPLAAVSLAAEGDVGEPPDCYLVDVADTPEDPEDDLEACAVETWFHRATTPAGNVEAAVAEAFPTFDTNPPAGSVADGNGGGYLGQFMIDYAEPGHTQAGVTFTGEFDGVIDVMDVTLHGFYNGYGAQADPATRTHHTVSVYLEVDGNRVFSATDVDVGTSNVEDPTAQPHQFDFAIAGLAPLLEAWGIDHGTTHTVQLTVSPKWVNTNPVALYVYDTTEVPGGIHFNPPAVDENAAVISAS